MMGKAKWMGLLVIVNLLAAIGTSHLWAAPMGTAFTYQGRFTAGGDPASGAYDFEFKLFDAVTGGAQVGSTVTKNDLTVTDGYFTTTLDFGSSSFTGNARWLQIAVRPGAETGAYTTLNPRHELTPTPYALCLNNSGTADYIPKFTSSGLTNSALCETGGNVGIGTPTPADKLHVVGTVRASDLRLGSWYISGAPIYNYTQGILISTDISVSDIRKMELYLEGNSDTPWGPIGGRIQAYNYGTGGTIINVSYTAYGMAPSEVRVFHHDGFLKVWMAQTSPHQTYRFRLGVYLSSRKITSVENAPMPSTGVTNEVILTPKTVLNNNVGIGTASPAELLHVSGATTPESLTQVTGSTSYAVVNAKADVANIALYASGSTRTGTSCGLSNANCVSLQSDSASGLLIAANGNSPLVFGTNANERARITGDGKIGVGTINPFSTVDVSIQHDYSVQRSITAESVAGDLRWGLGFNYWVADQVGGGHAYKTIAEYNFGATYYSITLDAGNVGIGTLAPAAKLDVSGDVHCFDLLETSDERLKTDIQPLGGVLGKLDQVRALSFRWNDQAAALGAKPGVRQIGVLAQELEQVFPELVTTPAPLPADLQIYPEAMQTAEAGQGLRTRTAEPQYKAVNYSELTVVLLEAVKELQAQNRALEQRVVALESKVK